MAKPKKDEETETNAGEGDEPTEPTEPTFTGPMHELLAVLLGNDPISLELLLSYEDHIPKVRKLREAAEVMEAALKEARQARITIQRLITPPNNN